jgi:hypothetical protein
MKKQTAADLTIRWKRNADGSAALTCTRADGSVTWQRQTGSYGQVFPAHDLTHYAIESVLGYEHGFYGLLAAGWEMSDFASPWSRGPIPPEAREVELLVGLFDTERRMGETWSAAEFQAQGELYAASHRKGRTPVTVPVLSEEKVRKIRAVRDELLQRWAAIPPGEALELSFHRTDAVA